MKKIFCLVYILLLVSCVKQKNESEQNVGLRGDIIAGYYSKPFMDSLISKINAIPELTGDIKTIKLKTIAADSIPTEEIVARAGMETIPFAKGFVQEEFMLVNNNENAVKLHEGVINDYGYNLQRIDTAYPPKPFNEIETWRYHSGAYSYPHQPDSIDAFYANLLKEDLEKEQVAVKKVKYFVSVCDIMLLKPHAVDDKTFEGGLLMFEIKVYDAATGKKEAQSVIMSKNSDKATSMMDSKLGESMQDELLYEDLLKNRVNDILNFLQNKKDAKGNEKPEPSK
ncbi:hypothetical protein ACLI09_10710 [Flavobacterium sp. RHBU_24]|uniref:hypothetical protein n=1 Tax=Flavobacterium sp. RHBU_24 TaxID=3391185 RepID=UPI003984962D